MINKRNCSATNSRLSFKGMSMLVLILLVMISSGCAHFMSGKKARGISTRTAYELQLELMRFADEYCSMVGEVADGLVARAKTPGDRIRPLAMKVSQANAAISIACDPNPLGGIMDMAVLTSLTRSSFEDYLVPKVYGEDAKGVVEKYKKAEGEAWQLVERVLDQKQQDELKKSIEQWKAENPDQRYVSFVRLQHLHKPKRAEEDKSKAPGSVFELLFIDPFAGLDPAAREIELSRHTAERAMYQFQRMPRLLDWQVSLVLSKTSALPEIQALLAATDRLSMAAEGLPRKIAEERVAIVKDLDANEPKLRTLLAELRKTLEKGGDAANSVNDAVQTLDDFVARFDKGSMTDATNSPSARPFDVTEYGASATQIAVTVREMNALVNSVDQKMLPKMEAAIVNTKSAGTELVDHVFRRAVAFVLITLVGAVAAMLSYRAVTLRFLKVK